MSRLVTIFGGSGFLGRQIARRMAQQGWRVRVAVRRPNEAGFVRTYGAVGQLDAVLCNIRDIDSVRAVTEGAHAVVNAVNLQWKEGKSTLDNVLIEGAANIARVSAELGVAQMVHISGIGVDPNSPSKYVAAKAQGEAAVLQARPDAVVLRPSVMFGPGDTLYNRLGAFSRFGPLMFIAGGKTRIQPAYVDDVAEAAALAAEGKVASGIYELGGPEVLTMREIAAQTLKATERRRGVVSLPFWVAGIGAGLLDMASVLTGGLFRNHILSRDQIALLKTDNVVSEGAKGFADLGIVPTAPGAVIDEYLWPYRVSGQYAAIKASAKNLRPS